VETDRDVEVFLKIISKECGAAPRALPLMLGVPFLALGAIALVEVAGVPAW
jgi:hypothetical protein